MKKILLIFLSINLHFLSVSKCHKKYLTESPIQNNESEKFRVRLEDFIFNFNTKYEILINQEVLSEFKSLGSIPEEEPFDFISYWRKSLKEFCKKINSLENPYVSHFNLNPEKKEEALPQIYMGELFISSDDSKILKCRFSAIEWKNVIYLMNIKIPE